MRTVRLAFITLQQSDHEDRKFTHRNATGEQRILYTQPTIEASTKLGPNSFAAFCHANTHAPFIELSQLTKEVGGAELARF